MGDTDTPEKPINVARDRSMYQLLSEQLSDCVSSGAMLTLAQTDEWQHAVRSLADEDLAALRAQYKSRRDSLDGKTKLEPFDGQVLTIFRVSNWYSGKWDNEGVTLEFYAESEPNTSHTALTSAPAIVRFCNSFRTLPTSEQPIRGRFYMVPVSDPTRARQGQKMWKVDRMVERQQMDIPF